MSVFANGREVSGKAQPNKIIAGFPSVCLSPPSPPAGPIPIPYPMFTDAKKTTGGTRKVKVKKKEVGKKNSSTYKKSKGNEAATRSFGMDVVSHTLSGKTKHQAYSFDVKVEGAGVDRFLDLTTTNHMNPATAVTIDVAKLSVSIVVDLDDPCKGLQQASEDVRAAMQSEDNLKGMQRMGNQSTTVTTGLYTSPSGENEIVYSCSRKAAVNKMPGAKMGRKLNAAELKATKNGATLKSDICNAKHEYKKAHPTQRPHCSHTESRILEDLWASNPPAQKGGSAGTLVMAINWKTTVKDPVTKEKKPVYDNKPCPHCEDLICEAVSCFEIRTCVEGKEKNWNEKCKQKGEAFPG